MNYYEFPKFSKFPAKRSLIALFIRVIDFAVRPSSFNEFQREVLDVNMNIGGTGACRCRPEETRRRRGSGGGAPGGWCALVGGRSLLHGGPTRPGHGSGELGHALAMAASAHDRQLQRRGDAVVAVDGMSVELGMGRPRGSNTYSSSGSSSFATRQWQPWP